MERSGMEWNGMEWNGMERNGMQWNAMECSVKPSPGMGKGPASSDEREGWRGKEREGEGRRGKEREGEGMRGKEREGEESTPPPKRDEPTAQLCEWAEGGRREREGTYLPLSSLFPRQQEIMGWSGLERKGIEWNG